MVVQKAKNGEVNWIIETKGRVWEGTTAKNAAMKEWCERIAESTGSIWSYRRIDQRDFDATKTKALAALLM